MNWNVVTSFTIAMMAIVNPVGKIPIWSEFTGDHGPAVRRRVARLAVSTSVIIALLFLLGGRYVLRVFDLDLASFRIAGGVILLITGIEMLKGSAMQLDTDGEDEGDDIATAAKLRFRKIIVPVAIPMMAGPGTLTTMVIYGIRASGPVEYALMAGVVLLVYGLSLLVLYGAPAVEDRVDPLVFQVFTRLFGLVIAALAVQFIVEGVGEVFPALLEGDSPIDADVQEAREADVGD